MLSTNLHLRRNNPGSTPPLLNASSSRTSETSLSGRVADTPQYTSATAAAAACYSNSARHRESSAESTHQRRNPSYLQKSVATASGSSSSSSQAAIEEAKRINSLICKCVSSPADPRKVISDVFNILDQNQSCVNVVNLSTAMHKLATEVVPRVKTKNSIS
jgi:hypothetical protein